MVNSFVESASKWVKSLLADFRKGLETGQVDAERWQALRDEGLDLEVEYDGVTAGVAKRSDAVFSRQSRAPKEWCEFLVRDSSDASSSAVSELEQATREMRLLDERDADAAKNGLPGRTRKRGRPRKTRTGKVDKVVAKIIKSGEHESGKWGDLVRKYADELPENYTSDALRKRVGRSLARQADGNSPRQAE